MARPPLSVRSAIWLLGEFLHTVQDKDDKIYKFKFHFTMRPNKYADLSFKFSSGSKIAMVLFFGSQTQISPLSLTATQLEYKKQMQRGIK